MPDPKARCLCTHELEWHDSCSRCPCPRFLAEGEQAPELVSAWVDEFRAATERAADVPEPRPDSADEAPATAREVPEPDTLEP